MTPAPGGVTPVGDAATQSQDTGVAPWAPWQLVSCWAIGITAWAGSKTQAPGPGLSAALHHGENKFLCRVQNIQVVASALNVRLAGGSVTTTMI